MANKNTSEGKIIQELREINESLILENKKQKERIDYLIRQLFGRKSEMLDPSQMRLLLGLDEEQANEEDPEDDPPPTTPGPKRKRRPARDRLPEDLPVRTEYIDPAEVEANPEAYDCIGKEERTELSMTQPVYFLKKIVRRKYARKADRSLPPMIVKAKPQLIENCIASQELLIEILLKKYTEHNPLYRQAQTLKRRYGIELNYKSMSGWMMSIGNWLQMIVDCMKEEVRASGYLQADETCIKYIKPGTGMAQQGYLWVYHAPNTGIVFEWHRGRGAQCLKSMLKDYSGDLQCDGYQAYRTYNLSRKEEEQYRIYACWAHARRYFHNARTDSLLAAEIIMKIKALYRIETELREANATPAQRVARRNAESKDILDDIHAAIAQGQHKHLPQSLTGKAISYTLNLWDDLRGFVNTGHVEIDNNLIENAIRPTAIGKKNWMFFGSPDSGKYSAAIFSVLETCRKLGVDQQEYLQDVLSRLPAIKNTEVTKLTPKNWQAERAKKVA